MGEKNMYPILEEGGLYLKISYQFSMALLRVLKATGSVKVIGESEVCCSVWLSELSCKSLFDNLSNSSCSFITDISIISGWLSEDVEGTLKLVLMDEVDDENGILCDDEDVDDCTGVEWSGNKDGLGAGDDIDDDDELPKFRLDNNCINWS